MLQWLTVLIFLVFSFSIGYEYLDILFYWVLTILIIGNVRRLFYKPYENYLFVIRRSLYVIPFFLPLFKEAKLDFLNTASGSWVALGILLGISCILPKWKDWRIALSKDFIPFNTYQSSWKRVYIIIILCAVPFAEEYFFRYFIIETAPSSRIALNIFLSAFLFFLSHYGTKWSSSSFSIYDFLIQFVFGLLSALLFVFSHSLIPSILAHLIYNSPHVINNMLNILNNFKTHKSIKEP